MNRVVPVPELAAQPARPASSKAVEPLRESQTLRAMPPINEITNRTKKTKNKTLAIPAAAISTPVNPKIDAIKAMTRNTTEQKSIQASPECFFDELKQLTCYPSPPRVRRHPYCNQVTPPLRSVFRES